MRSPNCGLANIASTIRSYAPTPVSFKNASISASDGGNPRKSSDTRRTSVARSASGDGFSPLRANTLRTKRSMFCALHAASSTAGASLATGGKNDQ